MNIKFVFALVVILCLSGLVKAQVCGDGICEKGENAAVCYSDCYPDLSRSALVIYNSNVIGARDIAEYYAEKRGIDLRRLCAVKLPPGQFALAKQFMGARKAIIENCICNAIHDYVSQEKWPQPCNISNIDAIAKVSPITHIVIIRGIPPRLRGTGWPTDGAGPSLDYYLSRMLYYDGDIFNQSTPEGERGLLNETNYAGIYYDSIDLQPSDSIRGYARHINVSLDRIVAYGRVEAMTKNRTLELIDRTIQAENSGVNGNFLVEQERHVSGNMMEEVFDFFSDMTSSNTPECRDYLQEPYGEWPYQQCRTGVTAEGDVPGESGSTIPRAINAGVFLGGEPMGNGQSGFDGFYNMLHWHKSDYDCTELCRDFPTEEEQNACRKRSKDYFREINTDCVGGAPGLIGWQLRSFPVQFMGFWPPGWTETSSGPATKTPPYIKSGGGYKNSVFTDDKYLHFGSNESAISPDCVLDNGTTEPCEEIIGVNLRKAKYFTPYTTIHGSKNYTLIFRYRNEASPGSGIYFRCRVRFVGNKSDTTIYPPWSQRWIDLSEEHNQWTTREINVSIDYDNYNLTRVYFDIYTTLSKAPHHGVDLDGFEIIDRDTGKNICNTDICSFNAPYIGYTNPGDYASNAIDRLGGIAWWGSSSHHLTGGFAFSRSNKFAGAFYSGRTLGESLAYTGYLAVSGIIYGDPLYRPSGVKIYIHNTEMLGEKDTIRDRYTFNQIDGGDPLYINAFHGHSNFATTKWQLSVCYEKNLTLCGPDNWTEFESGTGGVYDYRISTPLMDIVRDKGKDEYFIIRLRVWNEGDERNDLKNYAYFNYVYMSPSCHDNDGDGYYSGGEYCRIEDCDDNNGEVHPYTRELCNKIDDDCDGRVDEDCRCGGADFNKDGVVNESDKNMFFQYYFRDDCFKPDVPCCVESDNPCRGDFDFDGDVDFKDYFTFVRNYYGRVDCLPCETNNVCEKNETALTCPDDCMYKCDTAEPGDVDCNGKINDVDYNAFIAYARGHAIETPTMDCDGDGEINISLDLVCIKKKVEYYKCNNDSICQEREGVLTCFSDCGYLCDDKRIGDANCDGVIDMNDAYAIRDVFFGKADETPTMDCNQDGVVSSADVLCIRPLLECNNNGTCEANETYEKCPSDCMIGDKNHDGIIETRELPYLVREWRRVRRVSLKKLIHALVLWKMHSTA